MVCLLSNLFCVPLSASVTTTVILTGEDLYALLSSGEWEAKVNHGDIGYRILEPSFMSYHADGYFFITYDTSNVTNAQDIYGANILFSPTIEYDSVTSFEIVCGSILIYINQYAGGGGPSYAWNSSSSVNVIHDSGTYLIDTFANLDKYIHVQNVMYTPARMASYSATFDPTINLKSFIANQNFNLNLESNGDPNYYVYSMQTVVDSITVTFENPDDSEVLLNQIQKANEYLAKIESAIHEGTQDIIENQDENTQKIIDSQKENTEDIIDNQDKNTQEIIDNEDRLWHDTYDPSDEDISDIQGSISDMTDDLKEKLGLFTFIDDTLSQFFSLLDPDQVSSTNMIFPSLSITVYGESYEFVKQTEYDISSLQEIEGFDPLFTALHFFSAGIIYWALIAYLQSVFKRIFASGSGDEQ